MTHTFDQSLDQITCPKCRGTGTQGAYNEKRNLQWYKDLYGDGPKAQACYSQHAVWWEQTKDNPCYYCGGSGHFSKPDLEGIRSLITCSRGRRKGLIKTKRPYCDDSILEDRAYFVWRMCRFHTGDDVTLPLAASMSLTCDPYKATLERAAEDISAKLTGGRSVGAARWRSALYGTADPHDPIHPAAQPGGPVHDGHKPLEELAELI